MNKLEKNFKMKHLPNKEDRINREFRKYRREGIPILHYCECSKAIVNFYLLELEHAQSHQKEKFWNGNYAEKIISEVMVILRFVLSAGLGEARHAYRHSFGGKDTNSAECRIARAILKQMFGQLGWDFVPQSRSSIYQTYIPEKAFWRMFKLCHDIYSIPTWRESYGGEAWKKGIEYAMKAYKAVCLDDLPKTIIWTDSLINHCHNGGFILNKFDCATYEIRKILNEKRDGNVNLLEEVYNSPCRSYSRNEETCIRSIPLAPVK